MKFQTTNGRSVTLELNCNKYPLKSKGQSPSNGQFNLGRRIIELYNGYIVLEEFVIPETRLSLDFFVPAARIAFEFQGIQHDKFNKFYHSTKSGFDKQKHRDLIKQEWCKLNNILLIEVRDEFISSEELKKDINIKLLELNNE